MYPVVILALSSCRAFSYMNSGSLGWKWYSICKPWTGNMTDAPASCSRPLTSWSSLDWLAAAAADFLSNSPNAPDSASETAPCVSTVPRESTRHAMMASVKVVTKRNGDAILLSWPGRRTCGTACRRTHVVSLLVPHKPEPARGARHSHRTGSVAVKPFRGTHCTRRQVVTVSMLAVPCSIACRSLTQLPRSCMASI